MARRKPRSFFRRLVDHLGAGLFLLIIALAAAYLARIGGEGFNGPFTVVDGDTVLAGAQKLRLEGIDAPEGRQLCRQNGKDWPCGRKSTAYLRSLMRGSAVSCEGFGIDKYERPLVRCSASGVDLNAKMVAAGWAVSYGDYYSEQSNAKKNRVGIWAGEFETPQTWREIHRGSIDDGGIAADWFVNFRYWLGSWFD